MGPLPRPDQKKPLVVGGEEMREQLLAEYGPKRGRKAVDNFERNHGALVMEVNPYAMPYVIPYVTPYMRFLICDPCCDSCCDSCC